MEMKKTQKYNFLFLVLIFIMSCTPKEKTNDKVPQPVVSTIHPVKGSIQKKIQMNGKIIFLNKTTVTAPVSGYITVVNTSIGDRVKKNELLFMIQTKESKALQNTNVEKPNQFGVIPVYANVSGFVNILNITDANVFITEGNAMAVIANNEDLAIQVDAPFEYVKLLRDKKRIEIELPNNEVFEADFYKAIPVVDPVSQTQQLLFKLKEKTTLPENLNVLISLIMSENKESLLLPKEAVLTNETQDNFWIMKVTKDSLAIKVPIVKGLESNGKIEILNPVLNISDEIIVTGGYELPDSTKVKINEQ
ncbi:MAG: HlyD family efflux transporter periplasmic adaptor subunit [Proteiniphilum sp.]|nr:HlyD family efflux transporter periplasmic adaptor subunit [Proteiniphilum sp.]